MKTPKFTKIRKGLDSKFRFGFEAANGENLLNSEPYESTSNAIQGQKDLLKNQLLFAASLLEKMTEKEFQEISSR